jgi:hypothetical protein
MSLNFKEKINSVFYFILHPKSFKLILSLKATGYLKEEGWFNSLETNQPVDKNGNPIPWFTYPSIEFLKERLSSNLSAFEFGCGNSTLFFSERIKDIISIETNIEWFNKIKNKANSNCNLIYYDKDSIELSYHETIKIFNKKFDIIIIDSIERNEAMKISVNYLNSTGVIILDNSNVEEYTSGISYLCSLGFKRLNFWGIQAGYFNKTCTTIFYKPDNCLGI